MMDLLKEYPFLSEHQELSLNLRNWFNLPVSQIFKDDILLLLEKKNVTELNRRFLNLFIFGTAGVRSILGGGYSLINEYTVAHITLGLISFIKEHSLAKKIVIGFDSRNFSTAFADTVAKTCQYKGIQYVLFEQPVPSPLLAFATKFYSASVGVMITASHNPKEYNGYKIYNNNSGQFIPKDTVEIYKNIQNQKDINLTAILKEPSLPCIDTQDCVNSYFDNIKRNILLDAQINNTPIVYSPLFGAGKNYAQKIIQQIGGNLIVVEEQNIYDGNFPGCTSPNPEIHENFTLAIKYAHKNKANIAILTDPDADRVAIWENDYFFNGNEIGILLSYFLALQNKDNNKRYLISSTVSTHLIKAIALKFNLEHIETLTGFKYIGDYVETYPQKFLFGFEESYGYLIGNYIQDKDAIGTLALLYKLVQNLYSSSQTLYSYLNSIYNIIGFSKTETIEIQLLENQDWTSFIQFNSSDNTIFGSKIISYKNFLTQELFHLERKENTDFFEKFEKINLLQFQLENNIILSVRPSGTEPKLKIYTELLISSDQSVDTSIRNNCIMLYDTLVKKIKSCSTFVK